jgi:hypothetical protein
MDLFVSTISLGYIQKMNKFFINIFVAFSNISPQIAGGADIKLCWTHVDTSMETM